MAQGEDGTLRSVCQYKLKIDRLNVADRNSAYSIHGINTRSAENVETPAAGFQPALPHWKAGPQASSFLTLFHEIARAEGPRRQTTKGVVGSFEFPQV
jgi:hypothetical protein